MINEIKIGRLQVVKPLKIEDIRKLQITKKKSQILMKTLNKTLSIRAKNFAKVDIKLS